MKKTAVVTLIVLICLVHSIPFFILINIAFKSPHDTSSKWITPSYLYLENFTNAWQNAHLDRSLLNACIITGTAVVLVVIIGALASYPLARFQTPWNTFIYMLCISCMIVPSLTILVSLYKLVVDIGGIDTYWAIILIQVTFALPLTIFLYNPGDPVGILLSVSKQHQLGGRRMLNQHATSRVPLPVFAALLCQGPDRGNRKIISF